MAAPVIPFVAKNALHQLIHDEKVDGVFSVYAKNFLYSAKPKEKFSEYNARVPIKDLYESAMIFLWEGALMKLIHGVVDADLPTFTKADGSERSYADDFKTFAGIDHSTLVAAPLNGDVALFIVKNAEKLRRDLLVLLSSAAVSELSDDNVDNYFAASGVTISTRVMSKYLNSRSALGDHIASTEEGKLMAKKNDWFRYRITIASGIGIVQRAIEAIPPIFEAKEIKAVSDYLSNPSSLALLRNIEQRTIAKGYAVAESFDFLPSTWYMGDKAKANYPVIKYDVVIKYIEQYKKKLRGFTQAQIDASTDMATLNAIGNALI